ncbi:MAG: exonuclease-like protein [Promethearchaeota archaeon CR_4]|nr:MAG: exonuclease-like protein [Candidatus Lokiarchaeota archaeon CR_4]
MTYSDRDSIDGISQGVGVPDNTSDLGFHTFSSIEELFPTAVERTNSEGTYLEIPRFELIPQDTIPVFESNRFRLQRMIELVRGVGPHTAVNCRKRGTRTLTQLIMNRPRFATAARQVKRSLDSGDFFQLQSVRLLRDIDFIHCFRLEDLLFLDVETLGLRDEPIFLIGVAHFSPSNQGSFQVRQWFARDIGEEVAIMRQFLDLARQFKCLVSFNGKSFDLNVLRARAIYYFTNDFFTPAFLEQGSSQFAGFHHIDLFHESRHVWKNSDIENFRLDTIESQLLGITRGTEQDLPSAEVPRVYRRFLNDPVDTTDIYRVIEHNYFDVRSLVTLLGKVLQALLATSKGTPR